MATNSRKRLYEQLRKKLDALRVTLSDDEREIFDSLIRTDEVEAHRIKIRSKSKAATQRKKLLAPEVEAHRVKIRSKAKAANQRKKLLTPEVEAHRIKTTNKVRTKTK